MSNEELDLILSGSYKWVKVKQFKCDPNQTVQQDFRRLEEHHEKETTFLIEKVRELAQALKDKNNGTETLVSADSKR